jgi:hypothetical protein
MARSYHIDFAAFVADVDRKWIDNLLSHFDIPGVASARQGVARRLSIDAIRVIVLVRALSSDGGLPLDRALSSATGLLESAVSRTPIGSWLELVLDRARFQREVDRRVAEAVESVVPRRRGRPPGRPTGK